MDPQMMAMLMQGQGGGVPEAPQGPPMGAPMGMAGMDPGMQMGMAPPPPPQGDPMMMAQGPMGDMAAGGPMMASPLPTTDPGQLMALISQMAAQDQQTAMMEAVNKTKMMQAQAIQPVAAAMLQEAVSQASTMDMGGGPVGAA
jgi:hypothetical protein